MKICFPTEGNRGLSETVFAHFGSARYFTIYDTETKTVQIETNANEHHSHGGCQPLGAIADFNVDAIMTSGMGKRAVQLLNDGGIKVYLLNGDTIEEAVRKFEADELVELTADNACGGHGCH